MQSSGNARAHLGISDDFDSDVATGTPFAAAQPVRASTTDITVTLGSPSDIISSISVSFQHTAQCDTQTCSQSGHTRLGCNISLLSIGCSILVLFVTGADLALFSLAGCAVPASTCGAIAFFATSGDLTCFFMTWRTPCASFDPTFLTGI